MDRRAFLGSVLALSVAGTPVRGRGAVATGRERLRAPFVGGERLGAPVMGGERPWIKRLDERLGASTACLAGYTLPDALAELERMGFRTVEMIAYTGARHSVGEIPGFDYDAASDRERELVFEWTRPFRHISAHMPFENVHLLSTDEERRRSAVHQIERAMDGLAFLRGSLAVVHVGWPEQGMSFREIWRPMVDTLRHLGDYAAERELRVGIETMQPDGVKDYTELIYAADHPAVGATIDTGHIRGTPDIGLPVERRDSPEARERFNDVLNAVAGILGDKVFHFHLSDVRRTDWQDHQQIGTGIVDFPRLFDTMEAIRYDGLLVFELEESDTIGALRASRQHVEGLMPR